MVGIGHTFPHYNFRDVQGIQVFRVLDAEQMNVGDLFAAGALAIQLCQDLGCFTLGQCHNLFLTKLSVIATLAVSTYPRIPAPSRA